MDLQVLLFVSCQLVFQLTSLHGRQPDFNPLLPKFGSGKNSWKVTFPIQSMYGIFTYIWLMFMVHVGKYTIHGFYGFWNLKKLTPSCSTSKIFIFNGVKRSGWFSSSVQGSTVITCPRVGESNNFITLPLEFSMMIGPCSCWNICFVFVFCVLHPWFHDVCICFFGLVTVVSFV